MISYTVTIAPPVNDRVKRVVAAMTALRVKEIEVVGNPDKYPEFTFNVTPRLFQSEKLIRDEIAKALV